MMTKMIAEKTKRTAFPVQPSETVPIVIMVFFIADAVLVLLYLANQAAGEPSYFLTRLFNLDGEDSIPTWYSVIQLACVAALAGLFAARNVHAARASTWLLLILPLIFLALSMDEMVQIHEWLGIKSDMLLPEKSRENTLFPETGVWMFLFGIPFFAGFLGFIVILRRYFTSVPGVLTKFLLGLAILAIGATLIEILSNLVESGSVWYHLEIACEEGCEMFGVTVILWAFHDLLLGHGLSLHLEPVDDYEKK